MGPDRPLNWDAEKNIYTIIAPSTVENMLTHQFDIGRVAVLALDPAMAATEVPDHIRVSGNVVA